MGKKGENRDNSTENTRDKALVLKELQQIIDKYKDEHKLGKYDIIDLVLGKEVSDPKSIPVSIFSNKLACFEAIVKYLRENCKLKFREIAELTGRKLSTALNTYSKAKAKYPNRLDVDGKEHIPIEVLDSGKSVLEAVVVYLKDKGMRYSEIAAALKRDQRTIWTVYARSKK